MPIFLSNNDGWLVAMPEPAVNTLRALGEEFEKGGTEGLNKGQLFNVQCIKTSSGGSPFKALGLIDKPKDVVSGFKVRIFTLNT